MNAHNYSLVHLLLEISLKMIQHVQLDVCYILVTINISAVTTHRYCTGITFELD